MGVSRVDANPRPARPRVFVPISSIAVPANSVSGSGSRHSRLRDRSRALSGRFMIEICWATLSGSVEQDLSLLRCQFWEYILDHIHVVEHPLLVSLELVERQIN